MVGGKTMKKIILTFAAIAVLVSCQKENGPKLNDGTYSIGIFTGITSITWEK